MTKKTTSIAKSRKSVAKIDNRDAGVTEKLAGNNWSDKSSYMESNDDRFDSNNQMNMALSREDKCLIKKVIEALTDVYKDDSFLIVNKCHELSIVAAFYHYFKNEYEAWFKSAYPEVSIDMEYSKKGEEMCAKPAPPNDSGKQHMRIDFVIHKRQSQTQNLLAIEFKLGARDKDITWDHEKLSAITVKDNDANQVRNYELGISILLKENCVEMKYFKDGNDINEDESFEWENGEFCKVASTDIITDHSGRVNQRRSHV